MSAETGGEVAVEEGVPRAAHPAASWNVGQVCAWLGDLGLAAAVVANFRCEEINGKALLRLTDAELKTDLGVSLGVTRLNIAEKLQELQSGGARQYWERRVQYWETWSSDIGGGGAGGGGCCGSQVGHAYRRVLCVFGT